MQWAPPSPGIFGKNAYSAIEYETNKRAGLLFAKIGIVIGIIISVILGYYLPISIIARGTAVFFGVCAAPFLPMYVFALYWKGAAKADVVSGMVVGVLSSVVWMVFVHGAIARDLRISMALFGVDGVLPFPWGSVDPIFIAFPLAFLVTWIVSLFTKKLPQSVIERSFALDQ